MNIIRLMFETIAGVLAFSGIMILYFGIIWSKTFLTIAGPVLFFVGVGIAVYESGTRTE